MTHGKARSVGLHSRRRMGICRPGYQPVHSSAYGVPQAPATASGGMPGMAM
jgi:hypothetical protein